MSALHIVFVVSMCLVSACHLAVFTRHSWRRHLRSALSRLRSHSWKQEKQDEFGRAVSIEVNQRLYESVVMAAEILGATWICVCFGSVASPWNTEFQRFAILASNITVLCMRLCPKRILEKCLSSCYICCMACCYAYVYSAGTSTVFGPLRSIGIANVPRIAMSFAFGQAEAAFVCNLAVAVANTYVVSSMKDEHGEQMADTASVAMYELAATGGIVAFAFYRRMSLRNECSQVLQNQSLSVGSSAMTTLLGLVCDVVVELDESLRIVEHSPSLSAMLAVNRNTQGVALPQYISNESDRKRVEETLLGNLEPGTDTCTQGAMHVTLLDSISNNIPVEIFYVAFKRLGKGTNCFAGIREVSDQPVARLPPSRLKNGIEGFLVVPQEDAEVDVGFPKQGTTPLAESFRLSSSMDPMTQAREQGYMDRIEPQSPTSVIHSSVPSLSAWAPVDERFEITSTNAKMVSLVAMLAQWNIAIPRKSCCPLHAELNDLRSLLKGMVGTPCCEAFRLIGNAQCEECGLVVCLNDDEDLCEHCSSKAGCPGLEDELEKPRGKDCKPERPLVML